MRKVSVDLLSTIDKNDRELQESFTVKVIIILMDISMAHDP